MSVPCPVFIDLKGMLIRTLTTNKRTDIVPGQRICLTDDASMAGLYEDLIAIDCPKFAGKLRPGDKITVNYGSIELSVVGFESKEAYKEQQSRQNVMSEASSPYFRRPQAGPTDLGFWRKQTSALKSLQQPFQIPKSFDTSKKLQNMASASMVVPLV